MVYEAEKKQVKPSNYHRIKLLILPRKVYSRVLEGRLWPIAKPQIHEEKCRFCPGHGIVDLIFNFAELLMGWGEFASGLHDVFCRSGEGLYSLRHSVWVAAGVWDAWIGLKSYSVRVNLKQDLCPHSWHKVKFISEWVRICHVCFLSLILFVMVIDII